MRYYVSNVFLTLIHSTFQVFRSLNLKIEPGKTYAFCGESGCGKTTIFKLIQRIYDYEGSIRVDGCELRDLDKEFFFGKMSLVSQEPVLFTKTVRENIRLGCLDATDEEIVSAAKEANVHDFIMGLPDKYDTKIGNQIASTFLNDLY